MGGFIAVAAVAAALIALFDKFFSNPIVSFVVDAAFVLVVCGGLLFVWYAWKNRAKWEEEEKKQQEEEQRKRDEERRRREEERKRREEAQRERERNTLRFKCPYCGTAYAEYPAKSRETLRVCEDGCHGHFYLCEDQAPRTPQEAEMLAAEQRDAERVRSIEFHELHNAVERMTRFPSSCGWSVEFNNYEAIYFNGSDWIYLEYPSRLETTAGQYMLALSCGRMFPSVLYHVSVGKSDISSSRVRLFWCRKED